LFVSHSQVIGCEDLLRNDLLCVEWDVKLYTTHSVVLYIYADRSSLLGYLIGEILYFCLCCS